MESNETAFLLGKFLARVFFKGAGFEFNFEALYLRLRRVIRRLH